ncbi:molybdate-anion transporter-like [Anneissia japonica]|uniref:molybdate-anion transporter-like n=1 Tax=Anneissia japonica TaxID=1529436 RepID=UPI001425728B|nr:molybdate-anion transporter-like [Anneissia japonica]
MIALVYFTFLVLSTLAFGLNVFIKKSKTDEQVGNNPNFVQFQHAYFLPYFLALAADWLQGPYLYKLYSHYGFLESQIAILYVCGFAASVIFGTSTTVLADRFGRKKLCITFTVVYSISCLTKLSRSYGVLIIGRILGGMSTSLLFTAFESWYVHEHIECHDFPTEWLPVTFSKATFWNGVLAVIAGLVANLLAGFLKLGPVSPFLLAVPLLAASGLIVTKKWQENYGNKKMQLKKSCIDGLRHIVNSQRMLLIGAMQSLFESVMYIFVFIWTPVVDLDYHPPLGVVFSNFMVCIMIGSFLYKILTANRVKPLHILNAAIISALVATVICIGSTKSHYEQPKVSFLAFLILEIACGLYFPSMGFLRNEILPETHKVSIMNWFRVPLNMIACIGLMILHDEGWRKGTRHIFILCSILLIFALLCGFKFSRLYKDEEVKKEVESAA